MPDKIEETDFNIMIPTMIKSMEAIDTPMAAMKVQLDGKEFFVATMTPEVMQAICETFGGQQDPRSPGFLESLN